MARYYLTILTLWFFSCLFLLSLLLNRSFWLNGLRRRIGSLFSNIYKIIDISMAIRAFRLILHTSPLLIDNKLVLMHAHREGYNCCKLITIFCHRYSFLKVFWFLTELPCNEYFSSRGFWFGWYPSEDIIYSIRLRGCLLLWGLSLNIHRTPALVWTGGAHLLSSLFFKYWIVRIRVW